MHPDEYERGMRSFSSGVSEYWEKPRYTIGRVLLDIASFICAVLAFLGVMTVVGGYIFA